MYINACDWINHNRINLCRSCNGSCFKNSCHYIIGFFKTCFATLLGSVHWNTLLGLDHGPLGDDPCPGMFPLCWLLFSSLFSCQEICLGYSWQHCLNFKLIFLTAINKLKLCLQGFYGNWSTLKRLMCSVFAWSIHKDLRKYYFHNLYIYSTLLPSGLHVST